jgi:outer membrane immunogenic protein
MPLQLIAVRVALRSTWAIWGIQTMQKTLVAAAFAAVIGFGGGASAADVYSSGGGYKDAPAFLPVNTWTGFYIGAGGGYGSASHSVTASGATSGGNVGYDPITKDRKVLGYLGTEVDYSLAGKAAIDGIGGSGGFGTVEIGYDYQIAPKFVIGIFANYDFDDISATASGAVSGQATAESRLFTKNLKPLVIAPPVSTSISASGSGTLRLTDQWAAGGRIGYLLNPTTLAYFLGGYTEAYFDFPAGFHNTDFSGYVVGGGLQTLLGGGWSVKLEYRYSEFDRQTIFSKSGAVVTDEPTIQTVRAVLAYKVGSSFSPLEPLK